MAATNIFSLPMDQTPRYSLDHLRMNVLKFDLTGDLLATADSDRNLQIYSFSQNTYIFRRQYRSPIFAIEWKSTLSYLSALGRRTLYLGFGDGSIEELTFPSRMTPYDVESQLISAPQRDGLISHLAYNEGILISCNNESITIWRDTHDCGIWRKAKSVMLTELNSNASSPLDFHIENIIFKDFNTCIFVFKGGYILHFDVWSFISLWAAEVTVKLSGLPNALSHCGRFLALSLPPKCRLKQILGSHAPVHFVRAPRSINTLHSLPVKDVFLAHCDNHDVITWNSRTGVVLHHVNHQDYEHPVILRVAGTALEVNSASSGVGKQLSIVVVAATIDQQHPDKPFRKIRVWQANRTSSSLSEINFHCLSKVQVMKGRASLRYLRVKNGQEKVCRGLCRKVKDCSHSDSSRLRYSRLRGRYFRNAER